MPLFILIKRKGSRRFLGAIPAKKGVSRSKLKLSIRKKLKSGLTFRIITGAQLKRLILKLQPFGKTIKREKFK